jgi:hypothetical protein
MEEAVGVAITDILGEPTHEFARLTSAREFDLGGEQGFKAFNTPPSEVRSQVYPMVLYFGVSK